MFIPSYVYGPGFTSVEPLFNGENQVRYGGLAVLDKDLMRDPSNTAYPWRINPAFFLGRITAGAKNLRACQRTAVKTTAGSSAAIAVNTGGSLAFAAGDAIKIGAAAATTVVSVNYTTDVITIAAAQAVTAGDAVIGQDGSQTPVCVLTSYERMLDDNFTARNVIAASLHVCANFNIGTIRGDAATIIAYDRSLAGSAVFQGARWYLNGVAQ